jgi:hypothetical protein
MNPRFLALLFLFFRCIASLAHQEAVDVPFDGTVVAGSPIEVTGKISVQESVAGNQVKSVWEKNVTAKNISAKPILLLVGDLVAIGPHSNGGIRLSREDFFGYPIQPGDTIALAKGTITQISCCINPLDKPRDAKSGFRLLFVQFLDGSTLGDAAGAQDILSTRAKTLNALTKLAEAPNQGEQQFQSQLQQQSDGAGVLAGIRATQKEKGTDAAIAQTRRILIQAEEHETMILGAGTKR